MRAAALDRAPRWLPLLMGMILTAEHARHGAWGWALLALGLGIGWTAGWARPWPWVHSVGLLGGVALSALAVLPAGSPLSALIASSLALLSWDQADAAGQDDGGGRTAPSTLARLRGRRVMAVIGLGLGLSALALGLDLDLTRTAVGLLGLVALVGLRWIVRAIQRERP